MPGALYLLHTCMRAVRLEGAPPRIVPLALLCSTSLYFCVPPIMPAVLARVSPSSVFPGASAAAQASAPLHCPHHARCPCLIRVLPRIPFQERASAADQACTHLHLCVAHHAMGSCLGTCARSPSFFCPGAAVVSPSFSRPGAPTAPGARGGRHPLACVCSTSLYPPLPGARSLASIPPSFAFPGASTAAGARGDQQGGAGQHSAAAGAQYALLTTRVRQL